LTATILFVSLSAFGQDETAFAPGKNPEDKWEYPMKNEVRFGIGDMLFETLIWHDQVHKDYSGQQEGSLYPECRNYRFTPHFSGEYSRRLLKWLTVGMNMDIQATYWTEENFNNLNQLVYARECSFYNLCIMPMVRFHYFRREYVELYSAIALGIDVNGGTEANGRGQRTTCGLAAELTLLGVEAGKDHWFGFFDLGGLYGMKDKNTIYMMSSQIFKAGVIYRF